MNKIVCSCFLVFVGIISFSYDTHANSKEDIQDSVIMLVVQKHIDNEEYNSARMLIKKTLVKSEGITGSNTALEFDFLRKYIEASIYIRKFDFDSIFTIPTINTETLISRNEKISYLALLGFHSLSPLLQGNNNEFNSRFESYVDKCLQMYNWSKKNARQGQHIIFNFDVIIGKIVFVLDNNNHMNEIEIILKEYAELIGRKIDKDNWGYVFYDLALATYLNTIGLSKHAIPINTSALIFSKQPSAILDDGCRPYTAYANLTSNHIALNNFKEASLYADSAFYYVSLGQNYIEYIRTFGKMINIYNELGNYRKLQWTKVFLDSIIILTNHLIEHYENREEAAKVKRGLPFMQAVCNFFYGNYLLNTRNLDSAQMYYLKSLDVFNQNNSYDYCMRRMKVFTQLGWLNVLNRKRNDAEKYFSSAYRLSKKMVNSVFSSLSDYRKELFFPLLRTFYNQYNNYLLRSLADGDSAIIKLLNTRLSVKSLLLNDALQERYFSITSNDSAYTALRKKIALINDEVSNLYIRSKQNRLDAKEKIDSLEVLSLDYERMVTLLKNKNPYTKNYFRSDWQMLRTSLKSGEAAVEIVYIPHYGYFPNTFNSDVNTFGSNDSGNYCAIIVKSNSIKPEYILLNNSKDVGNAFELYNKAIYIDRKNVINNSIRSIVADSKNKLHSAYIHLWREIDQKLQGINKVYVSNDGIYNKINVSILVDDKGKYITDKYDVNYMTSLNRLIISKVKEISIQPYVLLVGNPNFDRQQKKDLYDNNRIEKITVATLRGENQLHKAWKNLAYTAHEIDGIRTILTKNRYFVNSFIREFASEDNLKKVNQPTILHIATHGYFLGSGDDTKSSKGTENSNVNMLMNSGLILAGANKENTDDEYGQDGVLTASEASRLNLTNTELVVLSACETALGEIKNGEGVYGLQRAFLLAGAQNLMMSLWKVDDAATKNLMVSFYKYYVKTRDIISSLKQAQNVVRKDLRYEHPMFWGAFITVQ